MALSLWDHDRRLHDLEAVIATLLEVLVRDDPGRDALRAAVQALRSRGDEGAAALLLHPASRAYAR